MPVATRQSIIKDPSSVAQLLDGQLGNRDKAGRLLSTTMADSNPDADEESETNETLDRVLNVLAWYLP
jgi:hypothetical protein